MTSTATTKLVVSSVAQRALALLDPRPRHSALLHLVFSFGLFGLFFVSIVDSSFVPLPIPGITDIMLVLMAAHHNINWLLLILVSSIGSAIGGYLSYHIGQRGGMAFLEKRVPPRIFHLVHDWMERHTILSVALPALLPPPMPLAPFILAAGALKMSKRTFMTTFTLSRAARHAIAVGLGLYYGRPILRFWDRIFAEYGTAAMILIWTAILAGCAFALWNIYKTSRSFAAPSKSETHA
ncbi:YqaA family protein [Edaphobacter aggregans]|uniref:YqaA family protein n=1 Tax=Edaphobacter aggregans TaxID=570835 RepID=UPI00068F08DA|nr:VTT domain-containing protein [Edaphobacter aggregans]